MKIKVNKAAETTVVSFHGKLNMISNLCLPPHLIPFTRPGKGPVIIDLSGCEFLDSQWLAVFIRFNEMARTAGNKVQVKLPEGHIKKLFEDTGMNKVMEIIPA
jgi:anti-anti-sigma factor